MFFTTMFKNDIFTFERRATRLMATTDTEREERFVNEIENKLSFMSYLHKFDKQFAHFSCSLYATDVRIRHTNWPQNSRQESKLYHSCSHHLAGYKTDALVASFGFAVHASKHQLGPPTDISVFRSQR